MVNTVNFYQPGTEPAIDINAIQRQRLLADMLMKQGQTPEQGQMVSGHYVAPGKASYVAQLANALGGAMMGRRADEQERQLSQNLALQRQKDAAGIMEAMTGKAAVPARDILPATPNDDEGNPMPVARTDAIPAQGPDMSKALAIALQSQDPAFRGMAPDMMKRQMDAAEFQQAMAAAGGGGVSPVGSAPGVGSAASPSAAPAGGGNTFGLDPSAYPFMVSPNARAQALGKAIQEANNPTPVAPGGSLYKKDGSLLVTAPMAEPGIQVKNVPGGGQTAAPVANYAESKAAQEAAIARAKNDQELVTRDVGGVPTTKTNAQWREYYGGGAGPTPARPAQAPQVPQGAPVRGNFTGTPEQVLDQINNSPVPEAVKAQMRQAYANQQSGNNPAFNPMGTGALPPVQGQSASDKEYATTRAKDYAMFASDVQKGARAANGTLGNLAALEALYKDPDVAKGGAAENISTLKNLAASTGVDVKGLGSEQAIQAITNKMALDARSTADGGGMPGAMSDADRNFLRSLTPNLSKTPEGRAQIIDAQRKTAQRNIEIARMANQYEQQNGRLDAGFDRIVQQYADQNQLFAGQKPAASAAPQSMDIRSLAAQELARRRGAK